MSNYSAKSELIPEGLPSGSEIVSQGKEMGKRITIGRTLFMQEKGVSSEAEYKRRMAAEGKIMFHIVFGLGSWQEQRGFRDGLTVGDFNNSSLRSLCEERRV